MEPSERAGAAAVHAEMRVEVARRAKSGAFVYPLTAAIVVGASPELREKPTAGAVFAAVMLVLAVVRIRAARGYEARPTPRRFGALGSAVCAQAVTLGFFNALIVIPSGGLFMPWLAVVIAAAVTAAGTTALALDLRVHVPFLGGVILPTLVALVFHDLSRGLSITLLACVFCVYLLHDGRRQRQSHLTLLRTQLELRRARDAALAADLAKTHFLAMMSHEIRTPMFATIGSASLLLGTELDETQRRYTTTIMQAGEVQLELLNDILDLSRIEARGVELELADFDLLKSLRDVVTLFEPLAKRKGLELRESFDPSLGRRVRGDRRRLQQVLANLVGNAVKFTALGYVSLAAKLCAIDDGLRLEVSVSDTGIGLSPAQQQRVFRPFEQADSGTARKYGGSGLGLAISRRLLEAMAGSIHVRSREGEGATFEVVIKLGEAQGPPFPEAMSERAPSRTRASGSHVLLVDDHALNRAVGTDMLVRLGCRVTTASDGREALARCQEAAFDMVLMDCEMSGLDGYEVTRRLRSLGGPMAELPVIAVTANAEESHRRRALDSGMDGLLAKPFGLVELEGVLDRWLVRSAKPSLDSSLAAVSVWPVSAYPRAVRYLSDFLGVERTELARVDRIARAFLEQWPQHLAALERAVEEHDPAGARPSLHALSGSMRYLGQPRFEELVRGMRDHAHGGDIAALAAELAELSAGIRELAASRQRYLRQHPELAVVAEPHVPGRTDPAA